jgi:bla regulator protein BlaR1
MQNLLYNISQVLGITIVHSLWQGLIIYIALRLYLLVFVGRSAALKYWVSYSALTFMLGWFVVTLFKELGHYNWLSTTALQIAPITLPALMHEVNAPANRLYFTISGYMPYLTMLYVVGLVFNTLRLTLAWNSIYRIRQNISNAGFEQTVKRLAKQLNVTKTVQAAFSEWVDVPCITGFIKPIILLPVSITCHLTTDEIEAILLHELAHIKRNDYLLNFLQQVIGILLFFNPFARLVAKTINEERENCCDDIVVRVTGSPFIYAQALLKLEENKQHQWQLALAATNKKYELLNRIERIMKTKTHTVNIRHILITVLALTCSISSIAWLNPEIKNGKVIIKNAPAIRLVTAAITGPAELPKLPPAPKHKKHISIKYTDTTKPALTDTTKKKYKIVVEDENGNKNEYNNVNELPAGDKEAFLSQSAGDKFLQSEDWKKQQKAMIEQSMEMTKKFNSPEWKKQQKLMMEQSMAMTKQFNSPKFKKQVEAMAKSGADMAKHYDSPEFKKQVEDMAQSGADMAKYYDSPEFKKKAEDMVKYYDSPEFKKQIEGMTKYYDSPKFKKQVEDMAKYYDSPKFKKQIKDMTKYYDSPKFKKQIEEMQKMEIDLQAKEADKKQDKADRKEEQKAREAEEKDKASQKEVKPAATENIPL